MEKGEQEEYFGKKTSTKALKVIKGKTKLYKSKNKTNDCTKLKYEHIYMGYNFLANLGPVTRFILQKHKLRRPDLELLLYLMDWTVFTLKEYGKFPKQLDWSKIDAPVSQGWIIKIHESTKLYSNVFKISTKGEKVVIEFYELLAGKLKLPEEEIQEVIDKSTIEYDKKHMRLLKDVMKLPMPDFNKKLFE